METLYLVCFGCGLVLSFIVAVTGMGHMHIGHLHVGHAHVCHATHGHGTRGTSGFNAFTVLAFLCWFGGAGYLLHRFGGFSLPAELLLSLVSGLSGGAILFTFFTKVLLPRERELTAADTDVRGVRGYLSAGIRKGGTGELMYSQNGTRKTVIVRAFGDLELDRGALVRVLRYERGVALVIPVSPE